MCIRDRIALTSGLGNLSWPKVALLGGISMALWNGGLLYAGMLVGQNWEAVIELLHQYNRIAVGVVLTLIIGWVTRRWYRRRRS